MLEGSDDKKNSETEKVQESSWSSLIITTHLAVFAFSSVYRSLLLCSFSLSCTLLRVPLSGSPSRALLSLFHSLELGTVPVKPMGFLPALLFALLVIASEGYLQQLQGEQRSVASFRGHGMSCLLCR